MKGIFRLLTMPALVAGTYTLFAILWIVFSDRWVNWIAQDDTELMMQLQTWKGLAFVIASGLLIGLVLMAWNYHRSRMDRKLTESEERYRRMIEVSPDAVVVHRDWRIVFANRAAREMYQLGDDYIGLSVLDLLHPDEHDRLHTRSDHLVHGGTPLDPAVYRHLTRDGREIEVEVTATLADFDGEPAVHAYVRDLSARKRAEREAARLEQMLEAFARNSPAGIAICRRDGRLLYSSPAWRILMGGKVPELPETEILERGPSVSHEQANDGRDVLVWCFFLDAGQRSYGLVALDITERQRAERRLIELNRERDEDNERIRREMDAFVYAVSHDLRAPLRSMAGFSKAVQEDHGGQFDPQAQRDLGRIREGAEKMSELLDGLLELSRLGRTLEIEVIDPAEVAAEVLDALRRERPRDDVAVEVGILPGVQADRELFRVILEDLLGNAWKFTHGSERAIIELTSEPDAVFVVRDNGVGFDMDYANKLFLPFQRLHGRDEFEGHGLGLARVQKAVSLHGGRVWAESAPGAGACFRFTLGRGATS